MFKHGSDWRVPIARWAVWDACASEKGTPAASDLGFVEPMLRRRLSLQARMALRVAHDCAPDPGELRMVYASRHGELGRSTSMLEALATGEEVSPTAFSTSVLSASVGLFSILQRNTAASTAISAGAASFGYGLLEACLQLADDPDQPVLLVYADEPLPDVYGSAAPDHDAAHAVGLLLQREASMQLTCRLSRGDGNPSAEPQSRAFVRCLETGQSRWDTAGACWTWSTQAS